ncbi:MAG: tyrosinase family protein [Phormidesmis sp.]
MAIQRISVTSFLQNSSYRDRYIAAVKKLKHDDIYQIFVDWHAAIGADAHNNVTFLGWHRIFIRLFEIELQKADLALQTAANPDFDADNVISLPWWDYLTMNSAHPNHASGRMWNSNFMGGSGNPVRDGPFRDGEWSVERRDPIDLSMPVTDHDPVETGKLVRILARSGTRLPSSDEISHVINRLDQFDNRYFSDFGEGVSETSTSSSFRAVLEGFSFTNAVKRKRESSMHNGVHGWVSGTMVDIQFSPGDPVFWLHHCNIDRIWALWQIRHPNLADQYPTETQIETAKSTPGASGQINPRARKLDEPLLPWETPGKEWKKDDGTLLLTTRAYTTRDVLQWENMGAALGSYEIAGVNARAISF